MRINLILATALLFTALFLVAKRNEMRTLQQTIDAEIAQHKTLNIEHQDLQEKLGAKLRKENILAVAGRKLDMVPIYTDGETEVSR